MARSRLDRRSFLKRSAGGAALVASAPAFLRVSSALAADVTTLEFWTPANDPVGKDIITKLVDGYNDTQGKTDGIKVNTRIKPTPPNTNDYVQYTTAMTSSASPDVVMAYTYEPMTSWAANGFIQPLDQFAKAAGVKEEDYFALSWAMMNFDGHTWAFLQEFDFNRFWWNTDIHTGEPPKSFDELDTLAKKYTILDGGKLTQAGVIPWLPGTAYDWNAAWGGSFYDNKARKWTINTPENAKFLDWQLKYVDMFGGRDKADALVSSIPATYGDIFQYGKIAFALEGEYLPAELVKQQLDLKYDIGALPVTEGVPAEVAVVGGGNPFVLPTKSKHPAEAIKFMQYMTSAKGVNAWCIPNSNIPPVKAAATDPAFVKALPKMKPWLDALNATPNHVSPPIPSPQLPFFDAQIQTTVDAVTYKKKTPAQALADLDAAVADQVKRFQSSHPDWQGE